MGALVGSIHGSFGRSSQGIAQGTGMAATYCAGGSTVSVSGVGIIIFDTMISFPSLLPMELIPNGRDVMGWQHINRASAKGVYTFKI